VTATSCAGDAAGPASVAGAPLSTRARTSGTSASSGVVKAAPCYQPRQVTRPMAEFQIVALWESGQGRVVESRNRSRIPVGTCAPRRPRLSPRWPGIRRVEDGWSRKPRRAVRQARRRWRPDDADERRHAARWAGHAGTARSWEDLRSQYPIASFGERLRGKHQRIHGVKSGVFQRTVG